MIKRAVLLLVFILIVSSCLILPVQVEATSKTIVVPDDFPTIQAAVQNASAGDTVFVKAGTYHVGHVWIGTSISLIGEGSEKTVIRGYYYPAFGMFEIHASDVTISGFNITGNSAMAAIQIETHGNALNINIIGNNIENSADGVLDHSRGAGSVLISGNNLTKNQFGVYTDSNNSIISENKITGSTLAGVRADYCTNVTIMQNEIIGNANGLELGWKSQVSVYENNITDNSGFGIQFDSGCNHTSVCNNNIARNQIGINLQNSNGPFGAGNSVYSNNLVGNSVNAFVEQDGAGNGTAVVSWDNGARGNYWSDYQSRYPNATEIGNSDIGNTPYIIDANNTDHYPLMKPVAIPEIPTWIILPLFIIATLLMTLVYLKKRKSEAENA
jgi:nitrous oxidase accessory protein